MIEKVRGPLWKIIFWGGPVDCARGATPDVAAMRVARAYFGREVKVQRLDVESGKEGAFAVVGKSGKVLTMFEVLPWSERRNG